LRQPRPLRPQRRGGRVLTAPGARTPPFGRRTCVLTATRPIDRPVPRLSTGARLPDRRPLGFPLL